MYTDEDIKPCPFCGGGKRDKYKPLVQKIAESDRYYVQCGYCNLRAPISCTTKQGAIQWWNIRPRE